MEKREISVGEQTLSLYQVDTAIIGSGCAGFNAADWLFDLGQKDIAIFTEGVKMGTSRNTGSDKQTYYKLSLAGEDVDSIYDMARTLFDGGAVHGDTALSEAAGSIKSFMKLVNLGVPFPSNRYGEYVGYKTDHDPRQRATSAGPLTSKYMTECLEKSVMQKQIPIMDHSKVISLLVENNKIYGFLGLHQKEESAALFIVLSPRVILATGGPAGCYLTSVYPPSQTGMSGMALSAGARGANLQEWQYGLASTAFRWNVSGTYQQVLPRYISIDRDGVEREFLLDYFSTPEEALDQVFLKGYQWPFDVRKIDGSSMIDMMVYHEIFDLKRRVFMDFRKDPKGLEKGFSALSLECFSYLKNSNALKETPIQRLFSMNPLAIDLYRTHGIDLYKEPLEIAVCAQHHNGGLWVDSNWQTSIEGLYAVGEAAGTFGKERPGGSALNSTQVGSMRAAEHISYQVKKDSGEKAEMLAIKEAKILLDFLSVATSNKKTSTVKEKRREFSGYFSQYAAQIRDIPKMKKLLVEIEKELAQFFQNETISKESELFYLFQNRDILMTQKAVLSAMLFAAEQMGSRGSALILCENGRKTKIENISYAKEKKEEKDKQVVTEMNEKGAFVSSFSPIRPLPAPDGWFESVWKEYRERTKRS